MYCFKPLIVTPLTTGQAGVSRLLTPGATAACSHREGPRPPTGGPLPYDILPVLFVVFKLWTQAPMLKFYMSQGCFLLHEHHL